MCVQGEKFVFFNSSFNKSLFWNIVGGFLASEFTLGGLIWLDYLAGDFTPSGLIREVKI